VQSEEAALKLKELYKVMLMKKMDDLASAPTARNML
jgi:hypothetical protein